MYFTPKFKFRVTVGMLDDDDIYYWHIGTEIDTEA